MIPNNSGGTMSDNTSAQRKLSAIMFTDMVGYSTLSQQDESLALELLEEHRRLLRPLFTRFNGSEVKTIGDAFLVEFASAVEATRCAIEIQKTLRAYTSQVAPEKKIQLRIGLHIGDILIEEGDVLGDGVNIASRIEPLAEPDGICVSESVAHQIENKIDLPLEGLGEKELKGIQKPVTVYKVVLPWMKKTGSLRLAFRKPLRTRWVQAGIFALIVVVGILWWSAGEKVPTIKEGEITRLAVLPFANLMNDPEQEYFVEGMHDALLTELSRINGLTVISRQSVLRYKGSDKSMQEIAQELQTHALIEGSILRADDEVRFNVQLIASATDDHLWAEMYDRKLENVLALHSEVAQAIADQVKITLTPDDESQLGETRSVNPETYELYLKGMYHLQKATPDGIEKGLAYLNEAVESDPTEPLGYAGLAYGYSWVGHFVDPQAYVLAREAASKALELDSTMAEVHQSLAEAKMYLDFDVTGAKPIFEKVMSMNPNLAFNRSEYAWVLLQLKRHEESFAEIERAVALDPLNPIFPSYAGWQHWWTGKFETGLEWVHKALELNPDYPWALYVQGGILGSQGKFEEAIKVHQRAVEVLPLLRWALAYTYALAGETDTARTMAEEIATAPTPIDHWGLALIYTALDDKDKAFEWLDRGYDIRWTWIPWIESAIELKPLQDDPRFKLLVEKITASNT